MNTTMKKRWISLYVENEIGVLAKILDCSLENHIIWRALPLVLRKIRQSQE